MQQGDHLYVARERETRAAGELRWAGFHRAIASLHTDTSTYTADLDPKKVAKVWEEHIEREPTGSDHHVSTTRPGTRHVYPTNLTTPLRSTPGQPPPTSLAVTARVHALP